MRTLNIECGDCGEVIDVIKAVEGPQLVSLNWAVVEAHRADSGCPATKSPRLVINKSTEQAVFRTTEKP